MTTERDRLNEALKTSNTEELRHKLSELTRYIEQEIFKCKQEKWVEFCSILDPRKENQHWNVINKGNIQPKYNIILYGDKPLTNDLDTANTLAGHYSDVSRFSYNIEAGS
ncbi:hypothetical protein CDAR_419991 [Caerostris darwini]|uniref:Uncharacterized protein n=1 Tax=Caerostris darwini TaxID=1538125 RepID=A0AAV4SND6_9ARAC|nr:hypothetical protein CDAR_419991 [Caerostris darwini]